MNKKHFTRRGPICAPGSWADIGKCSDFLTRELVENYREPSRLSRSIFVIPEKFTIFVFFLGEWIHKDKKRKIIWLKQLEAHKK